MFTIHTPNSAHGDSKLLVFKNDKNKDSKKCVLILYALFCLTNGMENDSRISQVEVRIAVFQFRVMAT